MHRGVPRDRRIPGPASAWTGDRRGFHGNSLGRAGRACDKGIYRKRTVRPCTLAEVATAEAARRAALHPKPDRPAACQGAITRAARIVTAVVCLMPSLPRGVAGRESRGGRATLEAAATAMRRSFSDVLAAHPGLAAGFARLAYGQNADAEHASGNHREGSHGSP